MLNEKPFYITNGGALHLQGRNGVAFSRIESGSFFRTADMSDLLPFPDVQSQDRTVMQSAGPMFFRDAGGNGTPVVLLHAASGNSLLWNHQFVALAQAGFRAIAIDYRGVGIPAGPGDWTPRIDELIVSLGVDRFHLLGTAAGGGTALQYALVHGAKLRSITIANSHGNVTDKDYLDMGKRTRPAPQFDELPVEFRELGPSYRAEFPEGVAQWRALSAAKPGDLSQGPARAPPALAATDAVTWAKLERFTLPTLLVTGDADLYMPPSVLRMFSARMPHADWAVIAETGHSSYWEAPEVFNRVLLDFIAKH